ncbi:MAG: hypothetical protein M3P18_20955 [Actinomycetota bacterium]|nr:hypothetical protein [Actinomycetota bacterium]
MRDYFSDREQGRRELTEVEIGEVAWGGLWAAIQTRLSDDSFGNRYPKPCPDGRGIAGCDDTAFFAALYGQVPDLPGHFGPGSPPPTLAALDALEFCHDAVGQPEQLDHHGYYGHWHLRFDQRAGQKALRDEVNLVMARNRLMYSLDESGRVVRVVPEPLASALRDSEFDTGDEPLDDHLTSAVRKILDPDPDVRREAVEELWDAWERLKSIEVPSNKAQSVQQLLDAAAGGQAKLRDILEEDARVITAIGNGFHIRHTEVSKAPIVRDQDLDYLFYRGFALIWFILRTTGRTR